MYSFLGIIKFIFKNVYYNSIYMYDIHEYISKPLFRSVRLS